MKRLLLILGLILIVGTLSAQNEWKYLNKFYGGVLVGNNGTGMGSTRVTNPNSLIGEIDSIRFNNLTTPTDYAVIHAGDTLNPVYSTSGQGSLFDYAARKYLVDTLNVSAATYTLVAADAGRVLNFTNATYTEVTIPANTIPVGSVITAVQYGGPVRFNCAANAFRYSVLDSCTMNTLYGTKQLLFRTTNKSLFIGNWID